MNLSIDILDRRILAGFRALDPLGHLVTQRILASGGGLDLMEKRPGEWVVRRADALSLHHLTFERQPASPAVGSRKTVVSLKSFGGHYASRDFRLALPRDPDPAHRGRPNSLFRWHDVILPFGTAATSAGMSATVLVTVTRQEDHRLVEGAVVRLRPAGGPPEAIGVTNAAGEALLAAPAVPLANSGGGATVTADLSARLDAIVDPALARFNDPVALFESQRAAMARMTGFIDPDEVIARLAGSATPAKTIEIAAGQRRATTIAWSGS